ncbi:MAG: hypothetical protein C4589_05730 [Peptococcaceae bacterium]|nr:MAG: hypothetical protein C4589_05730 [Peptococcaceae bacterium]
MIFLAALVFLGIILFETPILVKKKMWRELAAFAVYLGIGMALIIPQVLEVDLPGPSEFIETLFKPLVEWLKADRLY